MDAMLLLNGEAIANALNKSFCSTCTTLVADVLQLRIALKIDQGYHSEEAFRELSKSEFWHVEELRAIQGCGPWERGQHNVWSREPSAYHTDEAGPPFRARFLHHDESSLETSATAGCEFCRLLSDFFIHRPWPAHPCRVSVHVANRQISSPWRGISPGCLNDRNQPNPLLISCDTLGLNGSDTFFGCICISSRVEGQLFDKDFPSSPPTFSAEGLLAIKQMMTECRSEEYPEHTGCRRGPCCLPSRVLTVSSDDAGIDKIALVDGNFESPYAALSHCWGGTLGIKTTKENLRSHANGITIKELPKCFREAVHLCRKLQIHYLWIDALCIIQDDSADWDHEASRMAKVYENAELVISARDSHSSQGGLSFQRSTKLTFCPEDELGPVSLPGLSNLWAESTLLEGAVSPLECRGWAFQERALATAIIHIAHTGLFWECKSYITPLCTSMSNRECLHAFLKGMVPQDDFGQPRYAWYIGVQYYTKRLLTFQEDCFPAIAGFASKCEQEGLTSGRYLAGLWEDEILFGLTWTKGQTPNYDQTRMPAVPDRAPSWSWASIGRETIWTMAYTFKFMFREIALVDHENIEMSSWTKTAKMVQGRLPITAPFFPLPDKFWDDSDIHTDEAIESDWANTIDNQTTLAELISPLQQLDLTGIDTTAIIHYGPFFSESASPVLNWRDITISMDYPQKFYLGKKTFLAELCNFEVPGTFMDEPTTFLTAFLLLDAAIQDGQIVPKTYRRIGLVHAIRKEKNIGDPTLPLMKGADVVSVVLI
jgi:Heterokaryon incompatibility protein (HET)